MIRPLSFILLLSVSAIVLGQPLYKWVEPDGSITFSVNPPPAGVTFELVDADKPSVASTTGSPDKASSSDASGKASNNSGQSSGPSIAEALPQTVQRQPVSQRVAPQLNGRASTQPGIYRSSTANPGTETASNANSGGGAVGSTIANQANTSTNTTGRRASLEARSRKQRQCEDLQKRVVSLERRLRSRLTPDDMDNTVIHMARYQRSYDQHCVQ